jgi:hypothetical protein
VELAQLGAKVSRLDPRRLIFADSEGATVDLPAERQALQVRALSYRRSGDRRSWNVDGGGGFGDTWRETLG